MLLTASLKYILGNVVHNLGTKEEQSGHFKNFTMNCLATSSIPPSLAGAHMDPRGQHEVVFWHLFTAVHSGR